MGNKGIITFGIFTCCGVVISSDTDFMMGHINEDFDLYPHIQQFIQEVIIPNKKKQIKIFYTEGEKSCLNIKRKYSDYFYKIKEIISNNYSIEVKLKNIKHQIPINLLKIYSKSYFDIIKEKIIDIYDKKISNSNKAIRSICKGLKNEILKNFLDEELIIINIELSKLDELNIMIK